MALRGVRSSWLKTLRTRPSCGWPREFDTAAPQLGFDLLQLVTSLTATLTP